MPRECDRAWLRWWRRARIDERVNENLAARMLEHCRADVDVCAGDRAQYLGHHVRDVGGAGSPRGAGAFAWQHRLREFNRPITLPFLHELAHVFGDHRTLRSSPSGPRPSSARCGSQINLRMMSSSRLSTRTCSELTSRDFPTRELLESSEGDLPAASRRSTVEARRTAPLWSPTTARFLENGNVTRSGNFRRRCCSERARTRVDPALQHPEHVPRSLSGVAASAHQHRRPCSIIRAARSRTRSSISRPANDATSSHPRHLRHPVGRVLPIPSASTRRRAVSAKLKTVTQKPAAGIAANRHGCGSAAHADAICRPTLEQLRAKIDSSRAHPGGASPARALRERSAW